LDVPNIFKYLATASAWYTYILLPSPLIWGIIANSANISATWNISSRERLVKVSPMFLYVLPFTLWI